MHALAPQQGDRERQVPAGILRVAQFYSDHEPLAATSATIECRDFSSRRHSKKYRPFSAAAASRFSSRTISSMTPPLRPPRAGPTGGWIGADSMFLGLMGRTTWPYARCRNQVAEESVTINTPRLEHTNSSCSQLRTMLALLPQVVSRDERSSFEPGPEWPAQVSAASLLTSACASPHKP